MLIFKFRVGSPAPRSSPSGTRSASLDFLQRAYGRGRWRKLKGVADVRLEDGTIRRAEVHWYEAHGIGKRQMKIKRFLD
jgi:hypothetical protein